MDYRRSPNFLHELPWRSQWSKLQDDKQVEYRLAREFPAAVVYAQLLTASIKTEARVIRSTAATARLLATQKFSQKGFLALDRGERDSLPAKIRQHQLLDVLHFVLDAPSNPPAFHMPPHIQPREAFEEARKGFRKIESRLSNWGEIVRAAQNHFRLEGVLDQMPPTLEPTLSPDVDGSAIVSQQKRLLNACRHFTKGNCGIIAGNLSSVVFMVGYLLGKAGASKNRPIAAGAACTIGKLERGDEPCKTPPVEIALDGLSGIDATGLAPPPEPGEQRLVRVCEFFGPKLWLALGNQKPACLREAERKLWHFIFHWATSEAGDVFSAIPTLLAELVKLVAPATPDELAWFTKESAASRKATADGDLGGEMAIDIEPTRPAGDDDGEDEMNVDEDVNKAGAGDPDAEGENEDDDGMGEAENEDTGGEGQVENDDDDDDGGEGEDEEAGGISSGGEPGANGENDNPGNKAVASPAARRRVQPSRTVAATNRGAPTTPTPRKKRPLAKSKQVVDDDEDSDSNNGSGSPGRLDPKTVGKMRQLYTEFLERQAKQLAPIETNMGSRRDVKGPVMRIPMPTLNGPQQFYDFKPVFHHQYQLELVQSIYKAFQPNLQVPLNDPRSPFRVLDWDEYRAASPGNMLEIFRTKNLIIVDRPLEDSVGIPGPVSFDEHGLRRLGPLSRSVTMHDLSKPVKENYEEAQVAGKLEDLLDAKREGRSLNLLDCPFYTDYGKPQQWDLGCTAWEHLSSQATCKSLGNFPMDVCRWGLAATSGCSHTWHVDSSGFLAFFTLLSGVKVFAAGVPKAGHSLSSTNAFRSFSIDGSNAEQLDVFMVALTPPMQYIQTANQLHYVATPEDSIVLGGHAFVTPALQRSALSIYHEFVAGYDITNNDNLEEGFVLLSGIISFFHSQLVTNGQHYDKDDKVLCHLPNLSTFDGMLDLVALAHLMELGNVLSIWGYKSPVEHASERFVMITMRKMARELLAVAFGTFEVVNEEGDSINGWRVLFEKGLLDISVALTILKRQHEEKHGISEPLITAATVEQSILRALLLREDLAKSYQERIDSDTSGDFLYHGPLCTVKRRLPLGTPAPTLKPLDGLTFDDINTGILGSPKAKSRK